MRIRYDRGTLVLEGDFDPTVLDGVTRDRDALAWRYPAHLHRSLIGRLSDTGVRFSDEVRTAELPPGFTIPPLRRYQQDALDAWRKADHRGTVVLPTGSGKTIVALAAMAKLGVATLILVPTRVLLDQWCDSLARVWPHPVGRLGDHTRGVEDITVATYSSAVTWAPRIGARFGLVVVDEAHHVGGWCPYEILEMLVAPARLGLTATPPDNAHLAQHVGDVCFARSIAELAGDGLAPHERHAIPVELTPAERERYDRHRGIFAAAYARYMRSTGGRGSWNAFTKEAARTPAGRDALAAWRASREVYAYAEGKQAALRELLARHAGDRTLIFTADIASAYTIARELLIPPITHEIKRAERTAILDKFRAGAITALVSAQVLDEGLDVPEAEVAIIVGGSASVRRHVQRVGRVLRPREGKRAQIYELLVGETKDAEYAERRNLEVAS